MANARTVRTNLIVPGTASIGGAASVGGNLAVTGSAAIAGGITGGLSVAGGMSIAGTVNMANDLNVVGNLTVTGSFSFAGGSVFPDSTFQIQNVSDPTKLLEVNLGSATASTATVLHFQQTVSRDIAFPDASTTLVGNDNVQTLSNKGISASNNNISNIADANIASAAAISLSKLQALTASMAVVTDGSGFLVASAATAAQVGFLSSVAAAVVDISSAQTLSNKSLLDSSTSIKNSTDPTKVVVLDVSPVPPATSITLSVPSATTTLVGTNSAQTLTNKVFDASLNTLSNITDAMISGAAAILRSKIAAGSANQVVINEGSGLLSSEAQLATSRGGTGQDLSAASGVIKVAGGVVSAGTIVNADIDAAAAIARSKIAAGTASSVVTNDGGGLLTSVLKLPESLGGTNQATYAQGDLLYASAPNTLSKLPVGTPGQLMKLDDTPLPEWKDWIEMSKEVKLVEDWLSDGTGQLRWLGTPVGTGANNVTGTTVADKDHPGILELISGTTATGQAARYLGGVAAGAPTSGFFLGGGAITQEWLVRISALSNGTDRFDFDVGLVGAETLGVDSVRFLYADNVNGGNWSMSTSSASTVTNADSGIPVVAGTWYKLKIVTNAAGTSSDYYINNVLVGTVATNHPTVLVAPRARVLKVLGTTSVTGYVDYFKLYQRLNGGVR